jgi:hypothetical protein
VRQEQEAGWITAAPVWLVVADAAQEKYDKRWRVIRADICPHCGRPVSEAEWASKHDSKAAWDVPHGYCRELWERHNWQPGS